jgi:putative ABC transport system permease protein
MYVIEHSLLNLGKNKGRNILLGVIIFAIITASVVALAIYNTSRIILDETRAALQCAVRVAPMRQQMETAGQKEPDISLGQYRSFADSDFLDGSDIKESNRNPRGVDAVYYLKKPELLTVFETELRSKGLPDGYAVKTDESAFESVAGPVESLNELALTFLLVVLTLGAIVMALLSVIAIRERKYEIGVLRAMGMKKSKVALGLWIEIIAVTCICFALGMGAGTALSQPVSDAMMAGQTRVSSAGSTSLADRLNGTDDNQPEAVDISVNGITALEIFGVSILLASIAGVLSVSQITKSEPIEILMERN